MTRGWLKAVLVTALLMLSQDSRAELGIASFYWEPQGTASLERFDKNAMTAAHKTLKMGSRVRVTRLDNGRWVEVLINDRGPYIKGRVIDLSEEAARRMGMADEGLAKVRVDVVYQPERHVWRPSSVKLASYNPLGW